MSFSSNPYKNIELHVVNVTPNEETVEYICRSCGHNSAHKGTTFSVQSPNALSLILEYNEYHIRFSHKRTPENFATWSEQ